MSGFMISEYNFMQLFLDDASMVAVDPDAERFFSIQKQLGVVQPKAAESCLKGQSCFNAFEKDKLDIDAFYKGINHFKTAYRLCGNKYDLSPEYFISRLYLIEKYLELYDALTGENENYEKYKKEAVEFFINNYHTIDVDNERLSKIDRWWRPGPAIRMVKKGLDENGYFDYILLKLADILDRNSDSLGHDKTKNPRALPTAIKVFERLLKSETDEVRKTAYELLLSANPFTDKEEEKFRIYEEKYGIIAHSREMLIIFRTIEKFASTESSVLIRGESGTGKELIAKVIYDQSNRRGNPYVTVNCGAVPPNLFESQMFGAKKGAYSGANSDSEGYFTLADSGTIFLDEIGDMPLDLQVKLLRVVESGEYNRVGDPQVRKVNVRIIAATNVDIIKAVESGKFREDLYYRLNQNGIYIPSLNERKLHPPGRMEDIPYLCYHFFKKFVKDNNESDWYYLENKFNITIETFKYFATKNWPGNVRGISNHMWGVFIEIKNIIYTMPKDIFSGALHDPGVDWESLVHTEDDSQKDRLFRHKKYEEAVCTFINNNYKVQRTEKELSIDWRTARSRINSGLLQLGHHSQFKIDSFKDLLIEYGVKADQEELTKFVTKSFKDIIECKLMDKKKLVYAKADEKEGYIDELFKAFPEMVQSVQSQLK